MLCRVCGRSIMRPPRFGSCQYLCRPGRSLSWSGRKSRPLGMQWQSRSASVIVCWNHFSTVHSMRINYAIIFVSDMKRSVAFYRDVLGIPLRFESPHWSEFANEGETLALHAAKFELEEALSGAGGSYRLGF